MRHRRALTLALVAAAAVAGPLGAQTARKPKPAGKAASKAAPKAEAPAPATPAKLELIQVNDRRSSGHFATLNVHVVLPDVAESLVAAERVVVKKAVDDTGKDLTEGAQQQPGLMATSRAMGIGGPDKPGAPPTPTRLTLSVATPDRRAASIKELSGEIELYLPDRDPNATFTVERVLSKLGKPVSGPALSANRIEISLMSKAQLEVERKKQADRKRLEARKDGLGAEMIEEMVKSLLESLLLPEEGEVVAKVKDPDSRIQGWSYVAPDGKVQRVAAMDRDGFFVLSTWGEKPKPDWNLRIDITTPKSMVRHTFSLADVALP